MPARGEARQPCPLCSGIEGAGEVVFESELATVLLHPDWACTGHAMIVARRHIENLSDLSDEEAAGFIRTARLAESVLLRESGADRAILLKLGLQTPHLHLHIYPVDSSLDRDEVMGIIDARTRVVQDRRFVERVRRAMQR